MMTETRFEPSGFTLMEMMVVLAIIGAMSFFVVKNYSHRTKLTFVDRAAGSVIDFKRAALASIVSQGHWPGQDQNCVAAHEVLETYVGPLQANPWGYDYTFRCPSIPSSSDHQVSPSFIISQQVPSRTVAELLAARLPSTHWQVREREVLVETFVPMAILPSIHDGANQVRVRDHQLVFRQIPCPPGQSPAHVLFPKQVCAQTALHGYRLEAVPLSGPYQGIFVIHFEVLTNRGRWENGYLQCGVGPLESVSVYQYCE